MQPTDILLVIIALLLLVIELELVTIRKRINKASAHLVRMLDRVIR